MSIQYMSPAKIVISGEHSVVYGELAVSAAISLYTTVQIQKNNLDDQILIQFNQKLIWCCSIDDLDQPTNQNDTILALIVFQKQSGLKITSSIVINIQSDIPDRAGLGSSASFVVSLVSSLYEFLTGIPIKIDKLIDISKQIENIYHGTQGSGLDVVTSIYGGVLAFNKTNGFKQIDQNILNGYKILLINSGKKKQGGTSQVISQVFQRIQQLKNEGIDIIRQMGCLTQELHDNFINPQNHHIFQKQIGYNQQLLDSLGVVDIHAKQIVSLCENRNIACKITGAGNGGFCIAFISNEQYQQKIHIDLSNELEQFGYEIILTQISHKGYHKI